jgi:hypothetical protein
MKILYHVGETIGSETIVKHGVLVDNIVPMHIEAENERIILNGLKSVQFFKLNGLGTMVKILNNGITIFLAVPHLYFNIGAGFAIINYFVTKKVKNILDNALEYQTR